VINVNKNTNKSADLVCATTRK